MRVVPGRFLRLALPLLALPLAGGAALSDTRVHLENGLVSIHSRSAPLAEVLARFAQATGAEVVYETARPRQPVSVAIEGASPAEAIARLLEGQGLNYALRMDRTGTKVDLLVVSGTGAQPAASGIGSSRTGGTPGSPPARLEEPPDDVSEPQPEEPAGPEPVEEHESQAPAPAPADDTTRAPQYAPAPGGSAPGGGPAPGPSMPSSGTTPYGSPGTEPAQPQAPAAASYPAAPGMPAPPAPPVSPRPVSYPPGD
jgi:hypothetical protein